MEFFSSQFLEDAAKKFDLENFAVFAFEESNNRLREASLHLANWQESGFAGEMKYMLRDSQLFSDLQNLLPSVRSVISFVVPYRNVEKENNFSDAPLGYGKVARYAWGRDYHKVLKKRVSNFIEEIEKQLPPEFALEYRVFTDAVPLLERALAASNSLGFIGKNSLLITPGLGSFNFLVEIIWNLEIKYSTKKRVKPKIIVEQAGNGCKTCIRCIESCPTSAIVSPGVLDARECISYLTIEKKTEFSESEMEKIGCWIFGCDICQEVCPFNQQIKKFTEINEFKPESGSGEYLKLEDILNINDKEKFLKQFAGTAIMRAGRDNLLRNAISIVVNTKYKPLINKLEQLAINDVSSLVRNQAIKGLNILRDEGVRV